MAEAVNATGMLIIGTIRLQPKAFNIASRFALLAASSGVSAFSEDFPLTTMLLTWTSYEFFPRFSSEIRSGSIFSLARSLSKAFLDFSSVAYSSA